MSIPRIKAIPLTARAPLIVAVLMILVGAIASERVLASLTSTQERQLRDLAAVYLDGLSVAIVPAATRNDVWETFDALDRALRQDRSVRAVVTTVISEDGRILASTDPARFPTGSPEIGFLPRAVAIDALTVTGESEIVAVSVPLLSQGQRVGDLYAELDVSVLLEERRTALFYLILGNAAATLFLALAGYLVVRRMLRPVRVLSDHMGAAEAETPELIAETDIPSGANEYAVLFRKYNVLVNAERARKEAAERLAAQERLVSLGRLASSVAHEINNPLGGLINAVDTMKHHRDRPGVTEQSIGLLERGLLGIRDVVQAMLETNRPGRADAQLSSADIDDLKLLIGPEVRRLDQQLAWSNVSTDDAMAPFESVPVRQVLLNLLLNASRAAGQNGTVGFAATSDHKALTFCVCNSGASLPAKVQSGIVSGDLDAITPGMGLRTVVENVSALRAVLDIRETASGHTAIWVTLPIQAQSEQAA